jgi:hypothetical protein
MKSLYISMALLFLFACQPPEETSSAEKSNLPTSKDTTVVEKPRQKVPKQRIPYCSTDVLAITENNIDHLGLDGLVYFLKVLHPDCSDNAEFSQWSNSLLFQALEANPERFVMALGFDDEMIERDHILQQLESPVDDSVNLDSALHVLENTGSKIGFPISEVIQALRTAQTKSN